MEIHKLAGFLVVAVFTVGWAWGLLAWILKRDAGDRFWIWLTVAQLVAAGQAVIGVALYVSGHRASTLLHYAYGFFPIVVLGIAHVVGRRPDFRARPWVPFGWAAFICAGLALRAVMTGFGA